MKPDVNVAIKTRRYNNMYFETNATIFGNKYGISKYNRETKSNVFVPLGTAAFVE